MQSENTQSVNNEDQRNTHNSKHLGRVLGEITVIFVPIFTFLSYLFTTNIRKASTIIIQYPVCLLRLILLAY
ncbi:hypothetical protein J2736_003100 [Paenibacillus qinlingensis]|uniref:Uncharacterized protein n=1 Tax=Paenibacillus qinlingensis TaxID=1837343 RepID=A0ABU1NWQ1_9BACL|nr:hypothetical protein [Paenibacillus qinlingensis]